MKTKKHHQFVVILAVAIGSITVIAGCPSENGRGESGSVNGLSNGSSGWPINIGGGSTEVDYGDCPAPDPGMQLCGECSGICEYCPIGTCTPCGSAFCRSSRAFKSIAGDEGHGAAKPVLVDEGWDEYGRYNVALASGLDVPAEVTWHSDLDGDLGTGDNVTSLHLSPGVHTITYQAQVHDGDGDGKTILSLPVVVEIE